MIHVRSLPVLLLVIAIAALASPARGSDQEQCVAACSASHEAEDKAEDYCGRLCFACYTEADDLACDRAHELIRKQEKAEEAQEKQGQAMPGAEPGQ